MYNIGSIHSLLLLLVLFTFSVPNCLFGQKTFSGIIIDKQTKATIPYATIGLIYENKGISGDENGRFRITSKLFMKDSIRISSIGYQTLVCALAPFSDTVTFELERKSSALREVVVRTSINSKSVGINEFNNCSNNYYHVSLGAINQIAIHFEAPKPNMLLNEITLCKESSDVLFRLRIYGMDSITGNPLDDLSETVIEVNSSKRNVTIDMQKYNIIIPSKNFFVAVEWLFIPINAFTTKTKLNGSKYIYTSYKPGIAYNKRSNDESLAANTAKVWVQNYNGKWMPINPIHSYMNFLISAKLM